MDGWTDVISSVLQSNEQIKTREIEKHSFLALYLEIKNELRDGRFDTLVEIL